MADFADAFKRGLDNADKALKSKESIDALVKQLSVDVAMASDGKIESIVIEPRQKFVPDPLSWMARISSIEPTGKNVPYNVLVARKKAGQGASQILCEIKIASTGFPVVLTYSERSVVCSDEKGFASGIKEMLEHPDTGKILQKLLASEE